MYSNILVPIDGSEDAQRALAIACQLQQLSGGQLQLLNIPELPVADDWLGYQTGASPLDYTPEKAEAQGRETLEAAWQQSGQENQEAVNFIVRQGVPAHVIVSEAGQLGADAIVMGSRGLSDLKGLVTGSVSHKVSHLAPCTVITVHSH
ncbi:nucleotide-binding universal stress UspA family protein [Kushneria sinocarnis]|uniref:Nucleotide-binding universal stress UspA family protein n=1 Tax=Kushneria sinocarnis TaxID=595502 RepID=A0A420WSL4_9GAMM|nr:universal stress protein [Kushneria sinocarnis]RKQ95722.1 nucleotide-binding universal stress UspA family protein [Kushneria sinocarnis]